MTKKRSSPRATIAAPNRAPELREDQRRINIAFEMETLEHAVEGVRLLAELTSDSATPDADELHATLRGMKGMLALLGSRLRLWRRGLHGSIDPLLLWAPHNDHIPSPDDDEPDLHLVSW